MGDTVKKVMTKNPCVLPASANVLDAAMTMRDLNVGDVIVQTDGDMCGIVTDRDLVVRVLAEGRNPIHTTLGDIASRDLTLVAPDTPIAEAERLMRERAVRRLPVMDGGKPVGIVSIGDMAMKADPKSALADISRAPANV